MPPANVLSQGRNARLDVLVNGPGRRTHRDRRAGRRRGGTPARRGVRTALGTSEPRQSA